MALSGAEAGSDYQPAWLPTIKDAVYFLEQGMNTIRFPIRWAYLTNGPKSTTPLQPYLGDIQKSISQFLDAGLSVILDLHSYMRYSAVGQYSGTGPVVSADEVYNVWSVIARNMASIAGQYNGSHGANQLIFEIMNEPNTMKTEAVLINSLQGIKAIRDQNLTNLILIDGNSWTGLHSWNLVTGDELDGKSNASVFKSSAIKDPNYAIVVHQYFDNNGSGTSPTCQVLSDFKSFLHWQDFKTYVQNNKVKVFLSEFGSGASQDCYADVNYLLNLVEGFPYHPDTGGFIGWTAWVGGHGWSLSNFNNLTPNPNPTGQMAHIYDKHLTKP